MSVQAGLRVTIQTIWIDSGLASRSRAQVFDNTAGAMTLVSSLAVSEVLTGIYQATFIPVAGVSYVTASRVYTDGTFTTPDTNYAPGGSAFQCLDLLPPEAQRIPIVSTSAVISATTKLTAVLICD